MKAVTIGCSMRITESSVLRMELASAPARSRSFRCKDISFYSALNGLASSCQSETSFELNMNHDAQYTNSIQKFELEFIFERSFPWVNQNISGSKEGSFSFFYNDFEESGKTFFGSCQS